MKRRMWAALVVVPMLVAACSSGGNKNPSPGGSTSGGVNQRGFRISVVTHGQASDPFWSVVANGVKAAAQDEGVTADYNAPQTFDMVAMSQLIDAAVASKPDGLIVSIPDADALGPSIKKAVDAGIPVISINSGSDVFRKLGVLAHVGQPEGRAGLAAGRRLARAGVRHALCVNQQLGNQGLDARCDGLARAMREVGGRSRVLGIDDQSPDTPHKIGAAVVEGGFDGVLAMNATGGLAAVEGVDSVRRSGRVQIGTFDLGPDVLAAVHDGKLRFAVDQQPYLQGYLPIVMLANRARYGLFPAQGDVVATGAHFVTRDTAEQAIKLSERSIR